MRASEEAQNAWPQEPGFRAATSIDMAGLIVHSLPINRVIKARSNAASTVIQPRRSNPKNTVASLYK